MKNKIKRFFNAHGYPVTVIELRGQIIAVYNDQFSITLNSKNELWFDGYKVSGEEIVYHFDADADCLYSMVITGFRLTAEIFQEMQNEK